MYKKRNKLLREYDKEEAFDSVSRKRKAKNPEYSPEGKIEK